MLICEYCGGPVLPWCASTEYFDTWFPAISIRTTRNTFRTNGLGIRILKNDAHKYVPHSTLVHLPMILNYRCSIYLVRNFGIVYTMFEPYLYGNVIWTALNYILCPIIDIDCTKIENANK